MPQLTMTELQGGLDEIRRSPKDEGRLEMIVRRPFRNQREVLDEGQLTVSEGLVGDCWKDHALHPDTQLNIMNSRVIALVAGDRQQWPLAGDQLYIDMDLSDANLPPGTQLELGSARIEVTAKPHTGCGKFASRFGAEARSFVNSPLGLELHLRGLNARVVQGGVIRTGDAVRKWVP